MFTNIPGYGSDGVFIFKAEMEASNTKIERCFSWEKPQNASMIHFFLVGGGAGGGSGVNFYSGTGYGGAGGGGGQTVSMFVPAFIVPDTIYINVGIGGAGGVGSTSTTSYRGANGSATFISSQPTDPYNLFNLREFGSILAIAHGGLSGVPGTIPNAISTGGLGANSMPFSGTVGGGTPYFSAYGCLYFSSVVQISDGNNGASSGVTSVLSDYTTNFSSGNEIGFCGGGAAGGKSDQTGAYTAGGFVNRNGNDGWGPIITGGSPASPGNQNGNDGFSRLRPFVSLGGAGGAGGWVSPSLYPAGNGGNGGIGAGGGGGGAAYQLPSGSGGNGGDGLVIITVY